MIKIRISIILFVSLGLSLGALPAANAMVMPHPVKMYDKGVKILEQYRGNPDDLAQAKDTFVEIIRKYPESPFGFLGMSRVYSVEAYLYGDHYDMEKIRDLALPFATKALELGPSIRDVHENYAHFEHIFELFSKNQRMVQEYLYLFPEHPKTYFMVANFIRAQNEMEKALEYYKTALEMDPPDALRLKILKRIAMIYLNDYDQPEEAVTYYEQASEIWAASPVINEYMGICYLKMKKYKLAVEKLTKATRSLPNEIPQYHLWLAQGYLAEEEGRVKEAIDTLSKASDYRNHNSTLHYSLGNLYYKIANYESAYTHFKQVIDMGIGPQIENAYFFAGRSADSLGEKDIALDHYKKYLQINGNGQQAEWIRSHIPDFTVNRISE